MEGLEDLRRCSPTPKHSLSRLCVAASNLRVFLSIAVSRLRPVHNWTMEDTVQWLKDSVELPQYEKNFRDFRVTGNTLPRSAPASVPSLADVFSGH